MPQTKCKKLVGNYVINLQEQLGSGTFSTVYKGVNRQTGQQVAIKVLNKNKIEENQYSKKAFYTQIYIMQKLSSSNIIKCFEVKSTSNNYYIFQQLADEGTLRDLMKSKGSFDETEALRIFTHLLNGFGQLAKNGITHRDVKPQNILIKNGLLKLADFGFARQSENYSLMETKLGSPLYMSPQILKQEQYSYKCDIWALGVILYQLLVGNIPWVLKTNNMLQNIKLSPKISFPAHLKISQYTQEFVLKCLKQNQNQRFDWEGIFFYPLFRDKFDINFVDDNDHCIKLAFIFTGLRVSIHQKNIDATRLIKRLPDQLKEGDFTTLFKLLDCSLDQSQIKLIHSHILRKYSKDNVLKKQLISDFFKNIGIRTKSINLTQSCVVEERNNRLFILIARLSLIIEEKDIDLFELYRKEDKLMNNALSINQFKKLISLIDNNLSNEQIQILFTEMDRNKDNCISFSQFYGCLCQYAGLVKVENQQHQSLLLNK